MIRCNPAAYACGEGLLRARAWGSGKGGSQGFQSRVFGTRFWRSLTPLDFRRRSPPGRARGVKGGRAAPPCITKPGSTFAVSFLSVHFEFRFPLTHRSSLRLGAAAAGSLPNQGGSGSKSPRGEVQKSPPRPAKAKVTGNTNL